MSYSAKSSSDRRSLKAGINTERNRRRRNETTIQLRKTKRAAGLSRRRNLDTVPCSQNMETSPSNEASVSVSTPRGDNSVHQISSITGMLSSYFSQRNLALSNGVLQLLTKSEPSSTSSDRSISNAQPAKIEIELTVLSSDVGPYLLSLLNTTNYQSSSTPPDLNIEECILCIGNIAGESPTLRDHLLAHHAMSTCTKIVKSIAGNPAQGPSYPQLQLLEKTVWCISNLCRGYPKPIYQQVSFVIPELCSLLHVSSGDVLTNVCWALSYLTDGVGSRNEAVVAMCSDGFTIPRLLKLLKTDHDAGDIFQQSRAVLACLQILSNIVSSNGFNFQESTGTGVDKGVGTGTGTGFGLVSVGELVERVSNLLTSSTKDVCVEALFLLSTIANVGGLDCINVIVSSPIMIHVLLEAFRRGHQDVKLECLWVLGNITSGGSEEHLQRLVNFGVIPLLCQNNLAFYDVKTILMILDAIDDILIAGERLGEDYRIILDENHGIDMIESLQTHLNDDVYRRAIEIIDSHFGRSDENEDEDLGEEDYGKDEGDTDINDYWDIGRSWASMNDS